MVLVVVWVVLAMVFRTGRSSGKPLLLPVQTKPPRGPPKPPPGPPEPLTVHWKATGRILGKILIAKSSLNIWRSCTPPYDLILGGPGGGFCGPGAGFGGPGGGFSDSRSSGKPLLLLRLDSSSRF